MSKENKTLFEFLRWIDSRFRFPRHFRRIGGLERARNVAWNAYIDGMHFHEIAMAEPFKAERMYQSLAREVIHELGYPMGVRQGLKWYRLRRFLGRA